MLYRWMSLMLLCALAGAALAAPPAAPRFWERFPTPPGRATGISALACDAKQGLWIMAGQGVYYWNAEQRAWTGPFLSAGTYLSTLKGGPTTGLYATQAGRENNWGAIYTLEGGQVRGLTNFYYDAAYNPPGLAIARDGRIVNWAQNGLRIFANGAWSESPAKLAQTGVLFFDSPASPALYYQGTLYTIDAKNAVTETKLPIGEKESVRGACWGKDRILCLNTTKNTLAAFELPAGTAVDTTPISQVLGPVRPTDLFTTPDGVVWLMGYDAQLRGSILYRLAADGTLEAQRDTAGLPWTNDQFQQMPQSVVQDRDGALWFATKNGLFTLSQGTVRQFDYRTDNSPAASHLLLEGPGGIIFAGSSTGLSVYNAGTALSSMAPPKIIPLAVPGEPTWRYAFTTYAVPGNVLYVDGLLFTINGNGELTAITPQDGTKRFALAGVQNRNAWVSPGRQAGEVLVSQPDRVLLVNTKDGTVLQTVKCTPDSRITPIALGNEFIIASGARAQTLVRIAADGQPIWTCKLPGYLLGHPTVCGAILLAQVRGDGYGGQATVAVNLEKGTLLWTDVVNAYGAGTAFAPDGSFCVETDAFMSPNLTEGWLIARDPVTSKRRWHYRKAGALVDQVPVIDPANTRVYAAMSDGTVVCVDAVKGTTLWETVLPQPPAAAASSSYDPYVPALTLLGSHLVIVDAAQTLMVLDAATGKVQRRLLVTRDVLQHGKRVGSPRLLAAPWTVDGKLIVATESGILAYTLPKGW